MADRTAIIAMSIISLTPRAPGQAVGLQPRQPDFALRRQMLFDSCFASSMQHAILICDPKDIQYLTGSREGINWLILEDGNAIAISRHLMINEVRQAATGCEVILPPGNSTDRPDLGQFVVSEMVRRRLRSALVDTARISASAYLGLAGHALSANISLQSRPGLVEPHRSVKDDYEQHLITRCVEIASTAFRQLISGGASSLVGCSEREVAAELERLMILLGADRQGFPETGIIVASGPNSASAHHTPVHRRIARGEALLIDWGAELSSYRSDMTRTLFLGSPPPFATKAYPTVEKALGAASSLLAPGAYMGEIDRVARQTILNAGLPEFHYGVGHGVGLDIHEGPWLRANSNDLLAEAMVTTIEPGIYLPGIGGIRIENMFRVTADGAVTLGDLPMDLDSMILS